MWNGKNNMSNDLAVKTSQLTNAIKQMSDYLKEGEWECVILV